MPASVSFNSAIQTMVIALDALCKNGSGDDVFVLSQLSATRSSGADPPFTHTPNGTLPFGMVGPGAIYDPQENCIDVRPSVNMMGINGRASSPRPLFLPRARTILHGPPMLQEDSS